jgi:hypothetical protein
MRNSMALFRRETRQFRCLIGQARQILNGPGARYGWTSDGLGTMAGAGTPGLSIAGGGIMD